MRMRESDLTRVREVMDEFISQLPKRGQQETSESNASGEGDPKTKMMLRIKDYFGLMVSHI
jgi:hypothetical protein